MVDLVPPSMILSIITTPSLTPKDGRNYMAIQASSAMYVLPISDKKNSHSYLIKVSVAKHLGLQTLRLSSAPILPFNTTHYAYELELYLDK